MFVNVPGVAKKLDEQCFYDLTCLHSDENSVCMQINHNAICQCRERYHVVTHSKPTRRTFCTAGNPIRRFKMSQTALCGRNSFPDLSLIGSDLPTLLGVTTGIAVLAGLICMVLHLFSKTKYPRTRHFADAHSGPPIMFASDTGKQPTCTINHQN